MRPFGAHLVSQHVCHITGATSPSRQAGRRRCSPSSGCAGGPPPTIFATSRLASYCFSCRTYAVQAAISRASTYGAGSRAFAGVDRLVGRPPCKLLASSEKRGGSISHVVLSVSMPSTLLRVTGHHLHVHDCDGAWQGARRAMTRLRAAAPVPQAPPSGRLPASQTPGWASRPGA